MKLPKIKLPKLSTKQKAILLTILTVITTVIVLKLVFTYPAGSVVFLILTVMTGLVGYVIYVTYSSILQALEKSR